MCNCLNTSRQLQFLASRTVIIMTVKFRKYFKGVKHFDVSSTQFLVLATDKKLRHVFLWQFEGIILCGILHFHLFSLCRITKPVSGGDFHLL